MIVCDNLFYRLVFPSRALSPSVGVFCLVSTTDPCNYEVTLRMWTNSNFHMQEFPLRVKTLTTDRH